MSTFPERQEASSAAVAGRGPVTWEEEWYDSGEGKVSVTARARRGPPDSTDLDDSDILILPKFKHDIMGAASMLILLLTHPLEFRTLIQYKVWHEPKRDIAQPSEHATSGWDRPSMRRCWEFLDQTSRSFSGVIKELEGDLARVVSVSVLFRALRVTPHQDAPHPSDLWYGDYPSYVGPDFGRLARLGQCA